MKKCLIAFLAVLCAAFCVLPFSAFAADSVAATALKESAVFYSFDSASGTLTLTGTGAAPDYTTEDLPPWYTYRSEIKAIKVCDGITGLGSNLFRQLNAVTSVTLPNTLTRVGESAFFHASSIESIRFPAGIAEIGSFAFTSCSALQSIAFDDMSGNLNLGACVFIDCPDMLSAQFPVNTTFGQYSVGYLDEYGAPMQSFTLFGLNQSTAQYYAQAASHITFENALNLEYKTKFGHSLQSSGAADWYRYTPESSGTYHFYSYGDTDVMVALCNSRKEPVSPPVSSTDRSLYDHNFDLTCILEAGQTYYFRVTAEDPIHFSEPYTAYFYPGKITSFTPSFPENFVLQNEENGTVMTDADGKRYTYYNPSAYMQYLRIEVTYDNGFTDVFSYMPGEYNGAVFALSDTQETEHWKNGVYNVTLTYGNRTFDLPVTVHEHKYTSSVIPADCTNTGERKFTCSCGKAYTEIIAALGHSTPVLYQVPPKCEKDGYSYSYCSRCSAVLSEKTVLPALEHRYVQTAVVPPTVQNDGYTIYTCQLCGHSYNADFTQRLGHKITGRLVVMENPQGDYSGHLPLMEVSCEVPGITYTMTDRDGVFTLYLLNGTYTLSAGDYGHLNRSYTFEVQGGDLDLGEIAVMPFDFNEDGYINARDFAVFEMLINSGSYSPNLDFNHDGKNTSEDMAFATNFLTYNEKLDTSIYGK